jgi:hypothetical protein
MSIATPAGLHAAEHPLAAPAPLVISRQSLPSYVVNGSIRAVVPWKDDLLLVAAGSAGLHVVRQEEGGFPHPMDTECGATVWRDGWLATSRRGFFRLAARPSFPPGKAAC